MDIPGDDFYDHRIRAFLCCMHECIADLAAGFIDHDNDLFALAYAKAIVSDDTCGFDELLVQCGLPAEVREGPVCFCHLMDFFAFFDRCAFIFARGNDLLSEPFFHPML